MIKASWRIVTVSWQSIHAGPYGTDMTQEHTGLYDAAKELEASGMDTGDKWWMLYVYVPQIFSQY